MRSRCSRAAPAPWVNAPRDAIVGQSQERRGQMGVLRRSWIPFGLGMVAGAMIPATLWFLPSQPRRYVLTKDMDTEKLWFFAAPGSRDQPSVKGTLLAGSEFDI